MIVIIKDVLVVVPETNVTDGVGDVLGVPLVAGPLTARVSHSQRPASLGRSTQHCATQDWQLSQTRAHLTTRDLTYLRNRISEAKGGKKVFSLKASCQPCPLP